MLEETGTVVETRGNTIWVETQSRGSCSNCSNDGCSTSVLAQLFGVKRNRVALENELGAEVGQQVVIGISDGLLVRASLLIYLMPLLLMLVIVMSANDMGVGEIVQGVAALTGLGFGFVLVRLITGNLSIHQRFKPRLLRVDALSGRENMSRYIQLNEELKNE